MRRFGLIGLLVTLLIAGVAGTIGYNWGYSAGLANTAAANGVAVVYGPGWGGGFGLFGLLLGIFFLFLIFGAIRRAAWGWGGGRGHAGYGHGPGGWGRGPWSGGGKGGDTERGGASVPPFVDGMLQDWHQRAHTDPSRTDPARPSEPSSTPTGG
ncbi:MAG: hypothetical protein QOH61_962 [Chloroflexota bacterium]|nr:hypothetical protein [Chloroflexota bacterium]